MNLTKPVKASGPKERKRIQPRCVCGHGHAWHTFPRFGGNCANSACACLRYQPKRISKSSKPKVRKTPVAKLKNQAKALWAEIVKLPQRCRWAGEVIGKKLHECKGPLQGQHGLGKKAFPSVRYDLRNGWCGCAGSHTYWSHRQAEWGMWIAEDWARQDPDLPAEMRRLANTTVQHNRVVMEAIVAGLREELARRTGEIK